MEEINKKQEEYSNSSLTPNTWKSLGNGDFQGMKRDVPLQISEGGFISCVALQWSSFDCRQNRLDLLRRSQAQSPSTLIGLAPTLGAVQTSLTFCRPCHRSVWPQPGKDMFSSSRLCSWRSSSWYTWHNYYAWYVRFMQHMAYGRSTTQIKPSKLKPCNHAGFCPA